MPAAGNLPPAEILWLVAPAVTPYTRRANAEQALLQCEIASARLRMAVAASAWRAAGGANRYVEGVADRIERAGDASRTGICVVPKFTGDLPLPDWLAAINAVKRQGMQLVIDVCDYPFRSDKGAVPAFYKTALTLADAVVVNSVRMAEQMTPHFGRSVTVIEDAVLGAPAVPRFAPAPIPLGRLNVLWFGHPSNLRFLEPWIPTLIEQGPKPCRLTVVTQDGYGAREAAANLNAQLAPSFEMVFVEWSLEATRRELERCDVAILPSDPHDPRKSGASANRLAEVLQAGRFVVASPLHSYLAFSDSAWVGENLLEGLQWALANREAVIARIHKGQQLAQEKYAMDAIGRQWVAFFVALGTT
jgi:hypothetical protein